MNLSTPDNTQPTNEEHKTARPAGIHSWWVCVALFLLGAAATGGWSPMDLVWITWLAFAALAASITRAVSASEVFFERPPSQIDNVFGLRSGRPIELGSLFSPYWQVRLIGTDVTSQWLRQGVTASP